MENMINMIAVARPRTFSTDTPAMWWPSVSVASGGAASVSGQNSVRVPAAATTPFGMRDQYVPSAAVRSTVKHNSIAPLGVTARRAVAGKQAAPPRGVPR
jgi:hypothetical protein